jgi:hypothetical protein
VILEHENRFRGMAMKQIVCFSMLIMILCAGAGCIPGAAEKKDDRNKVPKWVRKVPVDEKWVYSIGYSGKTMFPTHAMKYATENARRELANMISTKVVSMIETEDSSRNEDISIESIAVTDEDLQGSQVVSHWVDEQGRTGVSPGTTYVLIRIKMSDYRNLLNKYR